MVSQEYWLCTVCFFDVDGESAPGLPCAALAYLHYQLEDWGSSAMEALRQLTTVAVFSVQIDFHRINTVLSTAPT